MNWKLIHVLILAAVVLVQSKSYIEVDEAGNEFEVKRFHIQGRQLNDKNQQCVISRRKRSPESKIPRQYNNVDPIFSAEEEDTNENLNKHQKPDLDYKNGEYEIIKGNQNHTISLPLPNMVMDQMKDDFEKDDEFHLGEESQKPVSNTETAAAVVHTEGANKEIKKEKKEKLHKITLIRPQSSEEIEEDMENGEDSQLQSIQIIPSTLVSNTAGNNYVIVHSQKVPAENSFFNVLPTEEDYGGQSGVLPFSWSYEKQPISTTAVWSTGDDVPTNIFNRIKNIDDLDYEFGNEDEMAELYTKHPTRLSQNKNKKKEKTQNKKRVNRRPVNAPVRHRPIRKNQNQSRPVKQIVRRKYHNRAPNHNANKSRKRNDQANKINKDKATPLAITSETMITTIDDDPQIECIIINKDTSTTTSTTTTTTTTRRPFWNILGRSNSQGQPRNYGLRKHTFLRFIA